MLKDDIYDRTELCGTIISDIRSADETQAYILYSGKGIGKSSVSKKVANLITDQKINKDVIRIKTTQNDNSHEGAFLENIFQYIRRYYLLENNRKSKDKRKRYKKHTYNYYIRHQNFNVIEKLTEGAQSNIEDYENTSSIIFQFIRTVIRFIGIKMRLINELETNYVNDKIMIGYIKYVLKKENIVLCIENTQNFDERSLVTLLELLIETKSCKNYFIFEFTLVEDPENFSFLNRIKDELEYSSIPYRISELNILKIEYVLQLVKQRSDLGDCFELISKIEQMYTGNVKKIENFVFTYSAQTIYEADPTFKLLQNLSKNQKYIIAIIILNNTSITEQVLKQVLNNSNDIYIANYNADIEYLVKNINLIENRGNYICVKDMDTIDSWNKNAESFRKYEALAYKNCEAIFLRILENGIEYSLSRKECILSLMQLYSKFDIIKLNNMLTYIDEVVYEFISIDELEKYLEKLITILYFKEDSLSILYNIFDICNRHQLVNMERSCIDKIEKIILDKVDEKFLFCYYTNLLHREQYEYLLEQIEKRTTLNVTVGFRYYLELFKIVAYVSLNKIDESREIVEHLENDLTLKSTIQYGYFLRLAEAYDKRNVAIPKVEESIKVFENYNMPIQAAKSKVSLCFLYSITGKLDNAQTIMNSAEKVLVKNIENKYVFNVNKACLYLLDYNYTEEVWDLLNESEKYAYIRFDKIAIIINKIIWCIENKNFEKGKYYEKKGLKLLEIESNHHLHAIFYYDCYVLYKSMNEKSISQRYYDLAEKNKNYCDTLKARMEGKKVVEDETTFLLQYPWHVCFVSYWYFDCIFNRI